jgi:Zn finger protein HypA/HybF involved in hydrogenase expression
MSETVTEIADTKFLERKMKKKLSVFKCVDCELKNNNGHVLPFLFHKVSRGDKCPNCGSSHVQKISIYAVIELRWNKSVRSYILGLRSPPPS